MSKRGFGSPNYPTESARRAQRAGNAALRAAGKVHVFGGEAARDAGRKGGLARAANAKKKAAQQ
jgi:hypothetical protein